MRVTAGELAGFTSFENAQDERLEDLTGIEQLVNLKALRPYNNQISDLSLFLADLTNLTELFLGTTQASDFSPLGNLTNLTELALVGNQINDLSPLANLTNLTELALVGNQSVNDLSPLANLTNLTALGLRANQIGDLSPLANLTNLRLGGARP